MRGMERRPLLAHEAVVGIGVKDHLRLFAGLVERVAEFIDVA